MTTEELIQALRDYLREELRKVWAEVAEATHKQNEEMSK